MRSIVLTATLLFAGACSSSSPSPSPGTDASTANDASSTDAGSSATDAAADALPQGRDGGRPGDPCTGPTDCREYPCLCNGQRVLRAGCLPAGICESQSEVCGGLGCQPTN